VAAVGRRAPVIVLVGLAIAGAIWLPPVLRNVPAVRVQSPCLDARIPTEVPVCEPDPLLAGEILRRGAADYRPGMGGGAVRLDPRWQALAATVVVPGVPTPGVTIMSPGWPASATTFVHELSTPTGHRKRIVVLEDLDRVTVIEPATLTGGPATLIYRGDVRTDGGTGDLFNTFRPRVPGARVWAGEWTDRCGFEVRFEIEGVGGRFTYRLDDGDTVTRWLLDPRDFGKRLRARRDLPMVLRAAGTDGVRSGMDRKALGR
jgi:hypothetical protein